MLHIDNTLISEDILACAFCCDIARCKGGCCNSEGESGAPLADDELSAMRELLPIVWDDLTPQAKTVIRRDGPIRRDTDGDWVTAVVDGRDCVYCTYGPDGVCLCAIEKAFREDRFRTLATYHGGHVPFPKPISCHLYPIRLRPLGEYIGLNYDRQDPMCHAALRLGRSRGLRLYETLRDALIRRFGAEWYEQLDLCRREMEKAGLL